MKNSNLPRIIAILFIFTASFDVFASDPLSIVITPTRFSSAAKDSGAAVMVIDSKMIERQNRPDIVGVLNNIPGVAITQNGGLGQTSSVFIRGAKSDQTLVMIDGVVANDPSSPSNGFDFSNLTTDNIERIEVLRGAASTIYGSDAIGGVINIITKKGRGKTTTIFSTDIGSYDTKSAKAAITGENFSADFSRLASNGYSIYPKGVESDGYNNSVFSTRFGQEINDNLGVEFTNRTSFAKASYDGFGSDSLDFTKNLQAISSLKANTSFMDGRLKQIYAISNMDQDRKVYSRFGNFNYDGGRTQLELINNYNINPHNIAILGLQSRLENFDSNSSNKTDAATNAAYLQHQYQFASFNLLSGIRFDNSDAFDSHSSYSFSTAYNITNNLILKSNFNTGFKAPSLFQLYSDFGNANLKPEKSRNMDIGAEYELIKDLNIGSYLFKNYFDDLIDYNFATNKYDNIGKARSEGVEIFTNYNLSQDFNIGANYTYTLARNDITGAQLLRRPKNKAGINAAYDFLTDRANITSSVIYVGAREDIDYSFANIKSDPYYLVNIAGSYKLAKSMELYGRIDNLLNENYQAVYGYESPGLSSFMGVRMRY